LNQLALVASARGDLDRAIALCEAALTLFRRRNDRWGELGCAQTMMGVAQRRGDVEAAEAWARSTLAFSLEIGSRGGISQSFSSLSWVARARGDPERAGRILGATEALLETLGRRRPRASQDLHDAEVARLRKALGEQGLATAWATGRAMTLDQAVDYAQHDVPDEMAPSREPSPLDLAARPAPPTVRRQPLTAREIEVVELIAGGLTNRQIAERLVITERTASSHVYHILGKLGFSSRAQVAAWAVAHGLVSPGQPA
jgi:DNA-binding CsgD family transcriptional regulator